MVESTTKPHHAALFAIQLVLTLALFSLVIGQPQFIQGAVIPVQ